MKSCHWVFAALLGALSCTHNPQNVKELLIKADALIDSHPDSVLLLLEAVPYPDELDRSLFADYALLSTRARDETHTNVAGDTLIFSAAAYFLHEENWEKAMQAAFYSGRVYQAQRNYNQALSAYLQAETLSQRTKDAAWNASIHYVIGELHYVQRLYSDAVERFKLAYEHFSQSPAHSERAMSTLHFLGNSLFRIKEKDKALTYFRTALQLAESRRDFNQVALTRHHLGAAYFADNEIHRAKEELLQALHAASDPHLQTQIGLTLAGLYETINQLDSALHFSAHAFERAQHHGDESVLVHIHKLLSRLEAKNGNHSQALHHHHQHLLHYDQVQDQQEKANWLEVQKSYDLERTRNASNRLLIRRQTEIILFCCLFIALAVIFFLFYLIRQRDKEARYQARESIYQMKEIKSRADSEIHAVLTEQFNLVKKIALLEGYLREDEREKGKEILRKVNNIIYEKDCFEWNTFYGLINPLHKGYFDRLKEVAPLLSEMEYRICCLTKAGLNNTEIAIILKSNVNVVQIQKTGIRRKLRIPRHGDIIKFMDRLVGQ
jgi:tetratricopeptide (TPR) repeat protein/DNA-binding CsgD family transcriptional regulator